jgi:diguanylate cyclase (GGDEF)-like protein/PAS domain S-box-containing protein
MNSSATSEPATVEPSRSWWRRAHRALMPDYNRKATAYWWIAVSLGTAVLGYAVGQLAALPLDQLLQALAGIAIAMVAGLFPIRIPRSNNSFAAGEVFIILVLLMFGPAIAALASAGEGFVGAMRTSKRWTSRIASPTLAGLAMFAAGSLLHAMLGLTHGRALDNAGVLLLATTASALLYFVANTALVTAVLFLKRSQWPKLADMFGNFGWVGLTFAGSASVACLLYLSVEQAGIVVLAGAVPVIAMLLTAMHTLFRQQEGDEALRASRVEAAEREAELAARHLREMEASERRFHSAFSHASIGMALIDADARVLQVNAALGALLGGIDEATLVGRPCVELIVDEHGAALAGEIAALRASRAAPFQLEVPLAHAHGAEVWAAVHGSVFDDDDGVTPPCLILQFQDVTARRRAEAGLQQIAFHDSLTGLPNRHRFQLQLAQALERVQRDPRHHFALLFLDFDRFKLINDSLGHAVGDEFLVAVARRIQQQMRPHDIVARLGGDEFAVIAEDLDDGRTAVAIAERVLEALRQPILLAGTEITTSASIGITLTSMGYGSPADMLRDADTAMYKAKNAGKARYALFDAALHTQVAERMRLEAELRRAIASDALAVAYQPIYALQERRITGFEALARWQHPELGAVSPAVFIPIAEEAGLMTGLTDFVMRTACRQLRDWQLSHPAFASLSMHVNVSGQDVAHPALRARVTAALEAACLAPRHLTLELTENILMARLEQALPTLHELRRSGVGLSIDDFGTGYSSLHHLATLPVDSLKIDRAFVAGLHHKTGEGAIVRAVLLLGDSLGKRIIAEGVETDAQLARLKQMGCTLAQGYLLARPLSAELAGELLAGIAAATPHAAEAGAALTRAAPLLH